MKSTTTALREHLDQEVTALCTCWTITRVDGTVLNFTDADQDVVQGGQTYSSIGAYQRTAIESTATLSVDNLEIVGSSNDLSLPDEELRAGLFDNAEVTIFMTPWLDSVRGRLRLRRGFFGEVQTLPNGTYQVELRGIMQRLAYNYTDIFASSCLYDLGSPECTIIIKGDDLDVGTSFAVGESTRIAQNAYKRGKAYDIEWGDPDFEIAGAAGGIGESIYWYNQGPFDLEVNSGESYTNSYSVRGGGGDGTLSQEVDLEATTGLPAADIDVGACFLTARAFRRDNADEGQFRIEFLDRDGQELGFGQQMNPNANSFNALQMDFAGDFTVELWIKLEASASINQAIFTQGSFGGVATGTRFTFENGRLAFRIDDNILSGTAQIIAQSSEEPVLDEWRHVALTRSGTDLTIIENFEVTATGTYAGVISIDEWANGPNSTGFVGKWDELRVWTEAKSVYELAFDAHHPIPSGSANLLRYYSFNDAAGADLTGGDGSFSFGNLVTNTGSPVAVPVGDALALGTATYSSGYADTTTTWSEVGVQDHPIPPLTRMMRINFDVRQLSGPTTNSFIDNLTGHIINTNEDGIVIGYMTNDIAWRCTGAGTANANQATGIVGSTLNLGATFVGEEAYLRAGRVLASSDARTFIAEVNDPRAVDAWFNEGSVIFETGPNAGVTMEVKSWNATTRQIELFLSLPANIKAGDYFSVYPGCDKSRISCAAIFRNIKNFFGTPDVPGQDELFRYPDAK